MGGSSSCPTVVTTEGVRLISYPKLKVFAGQIPNSKAEDRLCCGRFNSPLGSLTFLCIMDGHGGSAVSQYLSEILPRSLSETFNANKNEDLTDLSKYFSTRLNKLVLDLNLMTETNLPLNDKSGTTFLLAIVFQNNIYVCNVGDSRGVLISNDLKEIKNLNEEQTIEDEAEQTRLRDRAKELKVRFLNEGDKIDPDTDETQFFFEKASKTGKISRLGMFLTEAQRNKYELGATRTIATSSSIGDHIFGKILDPFPVISVVPCQPKDFVLLASDGLWDVMPNKELIELIQNTKASEGVDFLKTLQHDITKKGWEKYGGKDVMRDDITVIICQC